MQRTQLLKAGLLAACVGLIPLPSSAQSEAELQEFDRWVTGNLFFLAYHEVGHLLLDQVMRVDQQSDRLAAEQNADDIATWLIAPDPEEDLEESDAIAAIGGWLASSEVSEGGAADQRHLPDAEIYPDAETRASRIACLLLGSTASSPNPFEPLEPIAALRFNSSGCRNAYLEIDRQLEIVFGDTDQITRNPVARVRIEYDATGAALEDARAFLMQSRVLEDLKEDLIQNIGSPIDVVLRGASCGEDSPGFKYSPSRREITACYEEVDWFLYGDAQAGVATPERRNSAGDELGARPRRIAPLQARMTSPPPPPPRRP
jgi:hypothetical protein